MKNENEKLLNQIQSATGVSDCFEFCISMCELLEERPDSYAELLEWFFSVVETEYGYKKADLPLIGNIADKLDDYTRKYASVVESIIHFISVKGYDKHRYYNELWSSIEILMQNSSIEEKGFCLHQILWSSRIPYYELPAAVRISGQEFQEILDSFKPSVSLLTFAFEIFKSQKYYSELTSRVVTLLDQLDTFEQKTVFLVCFVNRLKKYWDEQNTKTEKEKPKKPSIYESKSSIMPESSKIKPVAISSDSTIKSYNFPDINGDKYDFVLAKVQDSVFLSDQGHTFVQLDKIFELNEPDVIKNLDAIIKQYGAKKKGSEVIIEINGWDENENEKESETLKKALLSLYSCVSFMLNMKIFYT